MVYTEEDIFKDCATDKKQLIRAEERVYKQVWLALCKWIVDMFDKGRGVHVVTLMQLSWVPDEAEAEIYGGGKDGLTVLRPVWRLSEGFEKSHRLSCKHKSDQWRPEDAEVMTKMEEINFHKLAMRYSKSLTKDQCFSALRDMFRRLGQVVGSGRDAKVFFGVGDFCCKDNKAQFVFDGHYHRFLKRPGGGGSQMGSERALSRASSRQSEVLVIDYGEGGEEGEGGKGNGEEVVEGGEARPTTGARPGTGASRPGTSKVVRPSTSARPGTSQVLRPSTSATVGSSGEIAGFFSGVPADDSWRHRKVMDRLERIRKVDSQMWKLRDHEISKTVDFETRNMLLGEHRRVAGEEESEEKAAEEKKKRYEHAQALRDLVKEREKEKTKRWLERHKESREDPFFVHLEPLEDTVVVQRKQAQKHVRNVLEQQIAARIKTAMADKERTLIAEQEELDKNAAKLRKTLNHADVVKERKDVQLKNDWATQVQDRTRTKALDSTINRCLTQKLQETVLGGSSGRHSADPMKSRPSTGLSAKFVPLSRQGTPMAGPSRLSSSARMSLSRMSAK